MTDANPNPDPGPHLEDHHAHQCRLEARIQASQPSARVHLAQAVQRALEATGTLALAHVGGETGASHVQGVRHAECSAPRRPARSQVAEKHAPKGNRTIVVAATNEYMFVSVLEGKVERLAGEVTHKIRAIAAPKGGDALFPIDANSAVDGPLEGRRQVQIHTLSLQQQLHPLNWGSNLEV